MIFVGAFSSPLTIEFACFRPCWLTGPDPASPDALLVPPHAVAPTNVAAPSRATPAPSALRLCIDSSPPTADRAGRGQRFADTRDLPGHLGPSKTLRRSRGSSLSAGVGGADGGESRSRAEPLSTVVLIKFASRPRRRRFGRAICQLNR